VWVEAGARNQGGVRTNAPDTTLLPRDAQAIREEIPLISAVSEQVDGTVQMAVASHNWNTRFRGVSEQYPEIRKWTIARGAFFEADDVDNAARVIVIGQTVRERLYGEDDPIGQVVRIQGAPFEIVGLFEPKGQSATGQDQDDAIWLPWTTARHYILGQSQWWLDDIFTEAVSPEAIPEASAQITAMLRQHHHLDPDGGSDDFNIRHPEDLLNKRLEAAQTLSVLLVLLASISLIVGGIGIMNVMLASVMMRTREIGVRMAVGASPAAIRLQFLGEALALTLVSGGLGIALAAGGAGWLEPKLGYPVPIAADAAALAIGFSVAVGVLFGSYPALRAAAIDPIQALYDR
jgi:putative ABC transport system permease protein